MIQAKKRFGQNFLQDHYYLDKIIQAIPDSPREIVEIGPGLGDLTQKLLTKNKVVAIEIDEDLTKILESKFARELASRRLRLIRADAIQLWSEGFGIESSFDLIANLPYYVATNLIVKAIFDPKCALLVVLIQKEVAQRFSAKPCDSNYGAISVLASLAGDVELLFDIPAQAFSPAPKVTSSVLRIVKSKSELTVEDTDRLSVLLKHSFAQPRRTLWKNLCSVYPKEVISDTFEELHFLQTVRPHETTPLNFVRLFKLLDRK